MQILSNYLKRLNRVLKRAPGAILLPVLLLLLASCAAGPSYRAPKTDVPTAFDGGAQTNFSTNETAVTWWQGFNDAELNQLIERALALQS